MSIVVASETYGVLTIQNETEGHRFAYSEGVPEFQVPKRGVSLSS